MSYLRVGGFVNRYGYSDIDPYEIVQIISAKCLVIRPMVARAETTFAEMDFVPGGFAGHYANQDAQKWSLSTNPNAETKRVRLHKDGTWRGPEGTGARYAVEDSPRKFYDFNF